MRKSTGMQIDALEDGYTDIELFSLSSIKVCFTSLRFFFVFKSNRILILPLCLYINSKSKPWDRNDNQIFLISTQCSLAFFYINQSSTVFYLVMVSL